MEPGIRTTARGNPAAIPGPTLKVLDGASERGGTLGSQDRLHPDLVVHGSHRVFAGSNAVLGIARMTVMSYCKALPIHGWAISR